MESVDRAIFFLDRRLLPALLWVNLKILFVYFRFRYNAKISGVESLIAGFNAGNIG